MDFDQTQPLPKSSGPSGATRHVYRCPCGNDVEIDSRNGGTCVECERIIPAAVTRFPMSMSMTITDMDGGAASVPHIPDEPLVDDLIGKKLGHFEIIESIGRGGMGQVYRALDTSLQRYVAVKVIRGASQSGVDSIGQQRLMHEAVAQARVNHPNIVAIYYVGHEDKTPFLAMELVDGYDASELTRQGQVPYETLCSIAIKITHALDTASQLGIVHSDIKPQNMLMLPDGNVKLSDFGMARLLDQDDSSGVGGTPNYLAPELLAGGKPSIQSDMYALGVTLFEMTFGRLPVELSGSSMKQWSEVHQTTKIEFVEPWPDHLPEHWKTVLQTLLNRNPDQRFENYNELGTALRSILPVKRRKARWIARAIAWFIDLMIIALLAIPVGLMVPVLAIAIDIGHLGNLVLLPGLVISTLLEYWWRQSIGRELVHVKVVNRYGLVPTRQKMLIRSVMRQQLLWFSAIGNLFGLFVPIAEIVLPGIGGILTIIDAGYMLTIGRGISLHDKLLRTEAVVGSDTN